MTAVNITRPDGRPEVYDTIGESHANCYNCLLEGNHLAYGNGSIFMCSPIDAPDGQAHWVCIKHLPDNVVIYDPVSDLCRSKDGQTVWHEGAKN